MEVKKGGQFYIEGQYIFYSERWNKLILAEIILNENSFLKVIKTTGLYSPEGRTSFYLERFKKEIIKMERLVFISVL